MAYDLAAVNPIRSTGEGFYFYHNSWSFEATGSTVADVADTQVTVARSATGVYTHTFPSDKKPSAVYNVHVSFSLAARHYTWSYVVATGVLTVNVFDNASSPAAAETDEELFYLTAVCDK